MLKKEKTPLPSLKSLKIMQGGFSEKKERAEVLNHSLIVRRVATHLARELKAAGEDIDLRIVSEAALLHDVGKQKEGKKDVSHPKEGVRILKDAGFSKEIIEIVGIPHFPQKKEELDNWEKRIVFYADLRVGQNIVSLDDRLKDIAKRWIPEKKITQKEMDKAKEIAKDVEQEIFSKLDIEPDDILDLSMPRAERYLRAIAERNLEDRAIKFFKGFREK